jgi:hypothetical protein
MTTTGPGTPLGHLRSEVEFWRSCHHDQAAAARAEGKDAGWNEGHVEAYGHVLELISQIEG